jgi:hypothetical protein
MSFHLQEIEALFRGVPAPSKVTMLNKLSQLPNIVVAAVKMVVIHFLYINLLVYEVLEKASNLYRSLEWNKCIQWILKQEDGKVWIGFMWLKIRTSGGLL